MSETQDVNAGLRVPPHDLQAEMGVLGSMLFSPEAVYVARERLAEESFYRLAHQEVFSAILHLADAQGAVDLILLRDEMQRRGKLEKIGGLDYLIELSEAVPSAANAEHYVEIVREHAVRRHLVETATEIQRSAFQPGEDVAQVLDQAEARILSVRGTKGDVDARDAPSVLDAVLERLEEAHQHPGELTGLATGYYDLDDMMGGLRGGEFIVLAARPSQGKTSLAMNILHNVCFVQRRPAALFSMEMPAEQIVSNFLCMHNRLDTKRFRSGTLEEQEWARLQDSITDLADLPLYIDDSASLSIMDLRARARRLTRRHDVALIVVDYLQLMNVHRTMENRAVEVGLISHGLKALARELEVPLLAVAQLSRRVEQESRYPRMSDLRESGAIEQDADAVLLLHRPLDPLAEERDEFPGQGAAASPSGAEAHLVLAKQRNGPTGVAHLIFLGQYLRFESRASRGQVP
jgi:replicative DNA helicase